MDKTSSVHLRSGRRGFSLHPGNSPRRRFRGDADLRGGEGRTDGQSYRIVDCEGRPGEDRERLTRERELEREEREEKGKARAKRIEDQSRRIWGPMPKAREILPWAEEWVERIDLWGRI